ncbi:undecaprenyl-diphosphatase [Hypnocyclicus thermotrophus]|uniref:Undecaprenyl-diphosphatase n=1 Tax=Hypnocyclicus thermotrophus TaxID=1627895 RepID=A0AA46DXA0_9FUSO|nr:undecaprenyl-diphosphate phosphatase [Hypnocyclicus thermotrophus]TDT67934.1 undecaprenyl-diphosphatase [Hypnocyclicus thermotrophus]
MNVLLVIILSIVEGITEFLPISSTGHMILVNNFLKIGNLRKEFMDSFLVIIQLGAILSVVVYFFKELNPFVKDKDIFKEKMILWSKIVIGVLPAVVLGLLFDDMIEEYFMDSSLIVALMLILYGIIFMFIEKVIKKSKINKFDNINYSTAFIIGIFQCLAMIPGTSRSGATIMGGLLLGLTKAVAAEFSFFLAIPTMVGATLLKIVKNGLNFTLNEWGLLLLGSFLSFIIAYLSIKWLMDYLKNKSFKVFGIYRIILGIIVLLLLL